MSYNAAETACRHWLEEAYPHSVIFKLGDSEPADFLVYPDILVECKSTTEEAYYVFRHPKEQRQTARFEEFARKHGYYAHLWVKLRGNVVRFVPLYEAMKARVIR